MLWIIGVESQWIGYQGLDVLGYTLTFIDPGQEVCDELWFEAIDEYMILPLLQVGWEGAEQERADRSQHKPKKWALS